MQLEVTKPGIILAFCAKLSVDHLVASLNCY
jgi:hypothetical protein